MGEAGFEPAKAEPDALQAPSFGRLDTPPASRFYRAILAIDDLIDRPTGLNLELRVLGTAKSDGGARFKRRGRDEPPAAATRVGEEIIN